jgi:hypothetical protein
MDRYCADRMVKRLVKRAGIDKRISPHSLRHSFITAALDASVPLRDAKKPRHTPILARRCATTGTKERVRDVGSGGSRGLRWCCWGDESDDAVDGDEGEHRWWPVLGVIDT